MAYKVMGVCMLILFALAAMTVAAKEAVLVYKILKSMVCSELHNI